jgi:hypothetical protein
MVAGELAAREEVKNRKQKKSQAKRGFAQHPQAEEKGTK